MASGPLTQVEKYSIQGMIHDGKSISEIAKELGRRSPTVEKYVNTELSDLIDTIVRAQYAEAIEEDEPVLEEEAEVIEVPQDMYDQAIAYMGRNGFSPSDARELLDSAIPKLYELPKDGRELYTFAVNSRDVSSYMIRETKGGSKGVSIMTAAAAEKSDDGANRRPLPDVCRSARGNVYNIKSKKIKE